MLLGSFLAGEASRNLQSQSLQCINHYYDWFIGSVYLSDVFFFTGFHSSDSEPLNLFLPRGIWADVLCAGDLSTRLGCSEEEVRHHVGKIISTGPASLRQFLHFCYM